jgi:hypothetical protein
METKSIKVCVSNEKNKKKKKSTTLKKRSKLEPLGSSRWATGIPLRFRYDLGNDGARESLEAFARFSVLTLGEPTTYLH